MSAIPIQADGKPLGFVVLVHDLSFVASRDDKTRTFLLVAFDLLALAYEDVVSLATRLSNRGYLELAKSFLEFANSPTGLAAFQGEHSDGRKREPSLAELPDRIAAIPYVVAANLLLRSKTLKRADVDQAVLFLVNAMEKEREEDEDPPVFTD